MRIDRGELRIDQGELRIEPLMRRALAIALEFERRNGYEHPKQAMASRNYEAMLRELGRSDDEIEAAMRLLKQEAGLRPLI